MAFIRKKVIKGKNYYYVVESKLKVMLEQDYLALENNSIRPKKTVILSEAKDLKTP